MNQTNQRAIRAFFAGLEEEANDLAARLTNGDDESVWLWFRQRYPTATKRATRGGRWREFVKAMREFCENESAVH
jgi:hypothetical protein